MKRVVIAIYIDPDFFPPTINAILNIAEVADEVVVISRNNSVNDFPYPQNVKLKKIGKRISVRESEKQSSFRKVFYFLKFVVAFRILVKRRETELVLLYDTMALFSFFLVKSIRYKRKIWYHNHDMPNRDQLAKYSIGGLAGKYEQKAMQYVNFFSLPSKDRLQYYPKLLPSTPVFIIPNYPSLKVYGKKYRSKEPRKTLKLIYQGFIGKGHALEECIMLLKEEMNGMKTQLILKGSVTREYKECLNQLADKYGVRDQLIWKGIGPYHELPELTCTCEIGIGINMNNDTVSLSQATASNKIYEYAACGLPVILYNSEQYIAQLSQFKWVYFTNGASESIKEQIRRILNNWSAASESARNEFIQTLNFENQFLPAISSVKLKII